MPSPHSKKQIARDIASHVTFYSFWTFTFYQIFTEDITDFDKAAKAMAVCFTTAGLNGFSHWLREITYPKDDSKDGAEVMPPQSGITQFKQRLPFTRFARSIVISALILQLRVYSYIHEGDIDLDAEVMTVEEFSAWVIGAFTAAFVADELPHIIKGIAKKCCNKEELELPALLRLIWETGQFGALAAATLYAYMHPVRSDDPLSFEGNPAADSLSIYSLIGFGCAAVPSLGIEIVSRCFTRPHDSDRTPLLQADESENDVPFIVPTNKSKLNWLENLQQKNHHGVFLIAKLIEFLPKTTQFLFVSYLSISLGVLYSNIVAHQYTDIDAFAHYVKSIAAIFGVVLGAWAHQHIYSLVFKRELSEHLDIDFSDRTSLPITHPLSDTSIVLLGYDSHGADHITDHINSEDEDPQDGNNAINSDSDSDTSSLPISAPPPPVLPQGGFAELEQRLNATAGNDNNNINLDEGTTPPGTPLTKSRSFDSFVDLNSQHSSISTSTATTPATSKTTTTLTQVMKKLKEGEVNECEARPRDNNPTPPATPLNKNRSFDSLVDLYSQRNSIYQSNNSTPHLSRRNSAFFNETNFVEQPPDNSNSNENEGILTDQNLPPQTPFPK